MGSVHSPGSNNCVKVDKQDGGQLTVVASNGPATHIGIKPGMLISVVQDGRLRKVLQMIASDSPRKIHELALECNLSESHLQHLFKQGTGFGLGRLLIEQRMQRAADLLGQTNLSIKEIAWIAGYEHTSSFTRAFERHYRVAPRRYRQKQGR
jgi:transcriptional regulator GlxA family with amidase domain